MSHRPSRKDIGSGLFANAWKSEREKIFNNC
jgi:hypothetical protein